MKTGTSRREFFGQTAALATVGILAGGESAEAAPAKASAPAGQPGSASPGKPVPLAPPDRQPPNLKLPEPVPRKIGWAVVGLGQLAVEEVLPAFMECRLSKPAALVSGHPDKARQLAAVYGLSKDAIYNYQDYDRLAQDDSVEAVYIALPNSMHAEFTIRALRAGKHVLCEKPMAASSQEARTMIAAAKEAGRKLMIGYRLHYEPFNQTVMKLCREKALGELKIFAASNCQDVQAPNIRLSASLAGGPLGDVGVYCINAARYVTSEEPVEVTAAMRQPADDPRFREVPESFAFTLRYASGVLAHCDCSFGAAESRRFRVQCTKGFIDLDPAFSYRGQELKVQEGASAKSGARIAEVLIQPVNHFTAEMDHFSSCIVNNEEPRTPGEMGLADMRIIEASEEAARTGKTVRIAA